MSKKMLLIQTADNRKLFTKINHLRKITEYANVFNASVYTVYSKTKQVLSLPKLAVKICDPTYDNKDEFREGVKLLPKKSTATRERLGMITNAGIIRHKIKQRLLDGEAVSLKSLKKEFHHFDLTDSCLSNHFSSVRKEVETEGKVIERVTQGEYCIKK